MPARLRDGEGYVNERGVGIDPFPTSPRRRQKPSGERTSPFLGAGSHRMFKKFDSKATAAEQTVGVPSRVR